MASMNYANLGLYVPRSVDDSENCGSCPNPKFFLALCPESKGGFRNSGSGQDILRPIRRAFKARRIFKALHKTSPVASPMKSWDPLLDLNVNVVYEQPKGHKNDRKGPRFLFESERPLWKKANHRIFPDLKVIPVLIPLSLDKRKTSECQLCRKLT